MDSAIPFAQDDEHASYDSRTVGLIAGDQLQKVTRGVQQVDAASPVLIVDLVGSGPLGVGPVTPALAHDPLVGAIEMFVIEQEGVVLQQELEGRGCETAWREE